MRTALTSLVAGLVLVLWVPAAEAQLAVGEAQGVRIVRPGGKVVFVFTPKADRLWRRVAGRRVLVTCVAVSRPDAQGFAGTSEFPDVARVPKRGRRLVDGKLPRLDYCNLSLPARTLRRGRRRLAFPKRLLVSVPLSRRGLVLVDERARANVLGQLLLGAQIYGRRRGLPGFPTLAQLVARVPRLGPPLPLTVVALAGPDESPPAGGVGYYSDGGERVAVVVLSARGRRLFIEYEPDGVVRSNVLPYGALAWAGAVEAPPRP